MSVKEQFGFFAENGSRRDHQPLIIDLKEYSCLASANDAGVPFSKIADYIEAYWMYL